MIRILLYKVLYKVKKGTCMKVTSVHLGVTCYYIYNSIWDTFAERYRTFWFWLELVKNNGSFT